jgi:transposase-like protein
MDASIKTLQQAIIHFSDPENCRQFMVAARWEDGVVRCPYCNSDKLTYLAKAKQYRCYGKHLKQKFSLKVGTIMEDSPIGLEKWLPAIWLLSNCRNGISSYEIHRALGITQKSAWFLLHRIRTAMKGGTFMKLGSTGGAVEVDECYIGGKPKNMHAKKRMGLKAAQGRSDQKAIVMGMLDRGTREVRTTVIPTAKREVLQREILRQVAPLGTVYTDGWVGYDNLNVQHFVHETVNHLNEYVRGEVHTQAIENFWSLLKRSLNGTYVAVEPFHLERYADEQAFRFNNRIGVNDAQRFEKAVKQIVGKRLTYEELTGKVGETAF